MKKNIYLILLIFIALIMGVSYFISLQIKNIKAEAKSDDKEIQLIWNKFYTLTNIRLNTIKNFTHISNCDNSNKMVGILNNINQEKKMSNNEMQKKFSNLEIRIDSLIIELYKCDKNNKIKLNNSLKSINDSLSKYSERYNSKALEFNSRYFSFPNNLFLDDLTSKRVIRLNYSNDVQEEMDKYSKTQHWVETGKY